MSRGFDRPGRGTSRAAMGALSAERLLELPVRLHGIQLGRPADLLLDPVEWRALGFDVRCGDEASRFLAWTTVTLGDEALGVGSALLLLEDVDFYRTRCRSVRALLGAESVHGPVSDLLLADDGRVLEIAAGGRLLDPDELELTAAEAARSGW